VLSDERKSAVDEELSELCIVRCASKPTSKDDSRIFRLAREWSACVRSTRLRSSWQTAGNDVLLRINVVFAGRKMERMASRALLVAACCLLVVSGPVQGRLGAGRSLLQGTTVNNNNNNNNNGADPLLSTGRPLASCASVCRVKSNNPCFLGAQEELRTTTTTTTTLEVCRKHVFFIVHWACSLC
jgi:hypothetical protein